MASFGKDVKTSSLYLHILSSRRSPLSQWEKTCKIGHPTKPRERERSLFPFFWPRLRSRLSSPAVGTQSQSPISRTRRPNSFPPLDPIAQTGKEERSLSPSSLDPVPTRLVWPRRPKRERGRGRERERERERGGSSGWPPSLLAQVRQEGRKGASKSSSVLSASSLLCVAVAVAVGRREHGGGVGA